MLDDHILSNQNELKARFMKSPFTLKLTIGGVGTKADIFWGKLYPQGKIRIWSNFISINSDFFRFLCWGKHKNKTKIASPLPTSVGIIKPR